MAILSQINYKGNLRTEATHLASNTVIISDAPVDNHGKGEAFSPTDLVSTALGQCMMTLMGIAAQNHGFKLGQMKAMVTKTMESNPRRIGRIDIALEIEDLQFNDDQKKILETAALNCPVAKSLASEIIQKVNFNYYAM